MRTAEHCKENRSRHLNGYGCGSGVTTTLQVVEKTMQTKNVVLTDFAIGHDWEFLGGLREGSGAEWDVEFCVSSKLFGSVWNKVKRMSIYVGFPFRLFLRREDYGTIVAWQQFYGILLAFYCRFFHVRKAPDIYILPLIYKEKKGLAGRIYRWFMRYSLGSSCVKGIFVYSEHEAAYYAEQLQLPEDKFLQETLGIEDRYREVWDRIRQKEGEGSSGVKTSADIREVLATGEQRKAERKESGSYYLSAGRSNRDYDFLVRSWPEGEHLHIVCDNGLQTGNGEKGADIQVLTHCYQEEFLAEIANCRAVVIPLQNENISSGQLVILQALMMGKPVIVTRNAAIGDYIRDGENGYVIAKSADQLQQAMERLQDPSRYEMMCRNARSSFMADYSQKEMGKRIGRRI